MVNFNLTQETPMAALSVGQFQNLLDEALKSCRIDSGATLPEVFGKEECSKLTGYSINSINKFIGGRNIPHYKKNGRVLFRRKEVNDWLLNNPVKTMDECLDEMESNLRNSHKSYQV